MCTRQIIGIPDILAIKLYTDLDAEQREFRKSFMRENEKETIKI